MAIQQQRAAELVEDSRQLVLDRAMVWPMHLVEPVFELLRRDRLPPERSVARSSARDDPKPAASARTERADRTGPHHRRIDLVLRAVAVDRAARSAGNHRSNAHLDGARDELVHERVLEDEERTAPTLAEGDQPVGIVAPGMGNRQEHGDFGAWRMDRRR